MGAFGGKSAEQHMEMLYRAGRRTTNQSGLRIISLV
jgi:hypothetical protein